MDGLALGTLVGVDVSEGNADAAVAVAVVHVDVGESIVSVPVPVDANLSMKTGFVLVFSLQSLPIVQTGSYLFGRCHQATYRHRNPAVRLKAPMARWTVSRQTTCPGVVSSDCACYSPACASKTFPLKETRV